MSGFDPFDPAFAADPYGCYQAMRDATRAAWSERLDGWMITRHADASLVLRDDARFSSDDRHARRPRVRRAANPPGLNIVSSDPPVHTRLRRILSREFTPRVVESWAPRIEGFVGQLLDGALARGGTLDVVRDLAVPLPLMVIGEMLGMPAEDRARLRAWSDDEITAITADTTPEQIALLSARSREMHDYFRGAIAAARAAPRTTDLLSLLVSAADDAERLSEEELVGFAALLLRAGNHTATSLIAGGMRALLAFPDQIELLHARPELWPRAIGEILRFAGPVQAVYRIAKEPALIHGAKIAPGDRVHVVLASANRDERVFAGAAVLRVDREAPEHLAFGMGIHHCLGAHIALLETQLALAGILARIPDPALAVPQDSLRLRRVWALRELELLPIRARLSAPALPC